MKRLHIVPLFGFALMALGTSTVQAQDVTPEVSAQNGRFEPAELAVPANTSFKVRITNREPAAIEFESFELHRERVVQPGETITVYMPALAPGAYQFFDDFHRDTPAGAILVK